jgi:hypothetical protein
MVGRIGTCGGLLDRPVEAGVVSAFGRDDEPVDPRVMMFERSDAGDDSLQCKPVHCRSLVFP